MKCRVAAGLCVLTICLVMPAAAQTSGAVEASNPEGKGFTSYIQFMGSSNSLGQVMDLDSSLGYNFSKYFGIDAGVPVYFVRGTDSTGATYSSNGLGNLYGDVRLTLKNPLLNYFTVATGFAPTGDTKHGLSTGQATYDWNNHFDHSFGHLTPFVEAGLGNSIQNSQLFNRPFTSLGFNSHFAGGAEYSLFHLVGVGASVYAIVPSGQQTVYSKFVPSQAGGNAAGRNPFISAPQVAGTADLTRDHGFSAWVDAHPGMLDLLLGYTRSVDYDLNTVAFGVGVNLGRLLHSDHRNN